MAESQDPYSYSAARLAALRHSLSERRMETYLKHGQQNQEIAILMHLWNSRLSKALRFPLESAEITIRNRVHYALIERWGDNWPRAAGFWAVSAQKTKDRVDDAYRDVGTHALTDRVVAALSFGFWCALFKGRFVEELWEKRIDRFFPNLPSFNEEPQDKRVSKKVELISARLDAARDLRNRIGHLEPILKMDLSREHTSVLELLSYACKDTAVWVRKHSTFHSVLRNGYNSIISEAIPFKKAIKSFIEVPVTIELSEACHQILGHKSRFVVITGVDYPLLLTRESVGTWILEKAGDEIVDLTEAVSTALDSMPKTPVISRRASLSDLRAAVVGAGSRFAILTETGLPSEKILGIVDVFDLI